MNPSPTATASEKKTPPPVRANAGDVAVIVIHGVANQAKASSARDAADLLEKADAGWDSFREDVIRLEVNAPEVANGGPAGDVAQRFMRRQLLSEEEEKKRATIRVQALESFVTEQEVDEEDIPKIHDAVRLRSVRRDASGAVQTRAEVFEMHWADLSRVGSGLVKAFASMYQLLFFLAGVGWRTVEHAGEAEPGLGKSIWWRAFQWTHRWAGYLLTRPVPVLNFLLVALGLGLLARHVPEAAVQLILKIACGVLMAVAAGALCFWKRSLFSPGCWWVALVVTLAAGAAGAGIATAFTTGPDLKLLATLLVTLLMAGVAFIFWKLQHRVPGLGWVALGLALVHAGCFGFLLWNGSGKPSDLILEAAFRTCSFCYTSMTVVWLLIFLFHGACVVFGSAARWTSGLQGPAKGRLDRAVWTAHLTFVLPTLVVVILNVALWHSLVGIASRTALPELTGSHTSALARSVSGLLGLGGGGSGDASEVVAASLPSSAVTSPAGQAAAQAGPKPAEGIESLVEYNWFTWVFDPVRHALKGWIAIQEKPPADRLHAGLLVEQLLADVSLGTMSALGFLLITAMLALWGLLPAIMAEVMQKGPNPEDKDSAASTWLGRSLNSGYLLLRGAARLLRLWGLIMAVGTVALLWFGTRPGAPDATAGLEGAPPSVRAVFWLAERVPSEDATLKQKAARIYRFSADAMAWAGLVIVLLLTGSGPFAFLALGFRSVLDVGLDVVNWLRVHPRGGNLRTQATARYVALLRHVCEARDEDDPSKYKFGRVVILAHSQGTVITADLFRFLRGGGLKNHRLEALLAGQLPVSFFTMGCPLRQIYSLRFPHLYEWARHEADDPPGAEPSLDILPPGSRWINFYRSGDYVGRHLWQVDAEPAWVIGGKGAPPHCEELCLGAGAHIHYWDHTAPEVGTKLNALVTS